MSADATIEVGEITYTLDPQPVRTSLSDDPSMMWGFQVYVLVEGELVGIKTCFVGRVGVQLSRPDALEGPIDALTPVLYGRAFEKVAERLRDGEAGDEILFA